MNTEATTDRDKALNEALLRSISDTDCKLREALAAAGFAFTQGSSPGGRFDAWDYKIEMHFRVPGSKVGALTLVYYPNLDT